MMMIYGLMVGYIVLQWRQSSAVSTYLAIIAINLVGSEEMGRNRSGDNNVIAKKILSHQTVSLDTDRKVENGGVEYCKLPPLCL